MEVILSARAERDLMAIGDWIARDNSEQASLFTRRLRDACLELGSLPLLYPPVQGRRARGLRKRTVGAYLIFYTVSTRVVTITTIVHGARDLHRLRL